MSAVGDFIKATTEDVEIGGVTFTLRRRSPQLVMKALGSKYFGLVTAAKNQSDVERVRRKVDDNAGREIAERTCRLFMLSPKCGDATDADAEVISYEDLDASGFAAAIVSLCLGGDMDFSKFSRGNDGVRVARNLHALGTLYGRSPADYMQVDDTYAAAFDFEVARMAQGEDR